ncbi:UPF0711 protein C18orf21 homolog isoform X2 [Festucalex cinctus]
MRASDVTAQLISCLKERHAGYCSSLTMTSRRNSCFRMTLLSVVPRLECPRFSGRKNLESAVQVSVCKYCFQRLGPDSQRVRLRPKRRPSARVQRLLRRRAEGKALSLEQKRLLRRFWASSSVLMATCHTCSKTSRQKGMTRDFLSAFPAPGSSSSSGGKHKTPPSAHGSTPRNTPGKKTPSKDKTPHRTPRSAASGTPGSASSSSSSIPSAKGKSRGRNWVVRRLRNILMCEDKPVSTKDNLKDFLSSL